MKVIVSHTTRLDCMFSSENSKDPILSRSAFQKLIVVGSVKVNGKVALKPNFTLRKGDEVLIDVPVDEVAVEAVPFSEDEVVYDDEYILVVDKKPGVRVESLVKDQSPPLFLAHRLDKDTSGLLVMVKKAPVLEKLQQQWKQRKVKKTYRVLVEGRLEPKTGRIEAPIFRSIKDRKRMAVSGGKKARDAVTEYKVLSYYDGYTYLEAYPLTGRTHQIRVHFSSIGHPVLGDATYGKKTDLVSRQFLHAYKLVLTHPVTGKRMALTSKMPQDLQLVLDNLS
ncbi:MAG: RluA family pseudouridine synthase [Patescibacteria group bacterium]